VSFILLNLREGFWKRVLEKVLEKGFGKGFWKRVLEKGFGKGFWKRVLEKGSFTKEAANHSGVLSNGYIMVCGLGFKECSQRMFSAPR
jgi:hypothetical protein